MQTDLYHQLHRTGMGSLARKTVKGTVYLYWTTKSHGQRHDEYIGRADDPEVQRKVTELQERELQKRYEALKEKAAPLGLTFKYSSHGAPARSRP